MIAEIIVSVLVILLGIVMFIGGVFCMEFDDGIVLIFGAMICIVAGGLVLFFSLTNQPKPTEEDVLAGKAVYQETITITQTGDSIKTYQIVWKGEDK